MFFFFMVLFVYSSIPCGRQYGAPTGVKFPADLSPNQGKHTQRKWRFWKYFDMLLTGNLSALQQ